MSLRKAADMAYPFDFSTLPDDIEAILGYVGEPYKTPHVWTAADVASARKAVGHWWPIWTPTQGHFDAVDGARAGSGMVAVLPSYGVRKDDPVFLDIEHNTWENSPADTLAGVRAWKQVLNRAGYVKAYAYVPRDAGYDWLADWTNRVPKTLPKGVIGIQYGGEVDGDKYDLSMFDSSLWGIPQVPDSGPSGAHRATDEDDEDDDMETLLVTVDGAATYVVPANLKYKKHIPTQTDVNNLNAVEGYTKVALSQALVDSIPDDAS